MSIDDWETPPPPDEDANAWMIATALGQAASGADLEYNASGALASVENAVERGERIPQHEASVWFRDLAMIRARLAVAYLAWPKEEISSGFAAVAAQIEIVSNPQSTWAQDGEAIAKAQARILRNRLHNASLVIELEQLAQRSDVAFELRAASVERRCARMAVNETHNAKLRQELAERRQAAA